MPLATPSLSDKLRNLVDLLRFTNSQLLDDPEVEGPALLEFRQALDNVRLTTWTLSELQNAREAKKDTRAAALFLTAERMRRFCRMIDDLSADLEHHGADWPLTGIYDLQESASILRERLGLLAFRRLRKASGE